LDLRNSVNLINEDRAEQYNKSEICNPKSKILSMRWFNGTKMGSLYKGKTAKDFMNFNISVPVRPG
jgi:hypothetical protein